MQKNQPLRITVSQPCGQNWNEMDQADKGRYCQQCKKTVIDFTTLSDEALYQYFRTASSIPCGRFHNDQLNRPIIPIKRRKSYWNNLYKAAAALIAFINMKYAGATGTKQPIPVTISPYIKNQNHSFIPGKVTISGIVKDAYGTPVTDASVMLGEQVMTQTDSTGKFSFDINTEEYETGKSLLLVIRHAGLNRAVRNYNPAMMSTTYDIVLGTPAPPELYTITMGLPLYHEYDFTSLTLSVAPGKSILSVAFKDSLSNMAIQMRNNPEITVNITAFPTNNAEKTTVKKLQNAVKKYMVEQEGIDETRLILIIGECIHDKKNIIEMTPNLPDR